MTYYMLPKNKREGEDTSWHITRRNNLRNGMFLSLYFATVIRVCFFKKIQDWFFKSERIQKRILHFFTKQINPRSFRSWRIKGTEESTSRVDSSDPLTHHDPRDLGLICLVKKRKIRFQILSDLKIQSWIFAPAGGIIVSPAYTHKECVKYWCSMSVVWESIPI